MLGFVFCVKYSKIFVCVCIWTYVCVPMVYPVVIQYRFDPDNDSLGIHTIPIDFKGNTTI